MKPNARRDMALAIFGLVAIAVLLLLTGPA